MKKVLFFLVMMLLTWHCIGQAPNISYASGVHSYAVGTAITPLSSTNTGGVIPATVYGQVSTFTTGFDTVYYVAVDNLGNIFTADYWTNKIYKITPAGTVSLFTGSGAQTSVDGIGTLASFNRPLGIAVDVNNNVLVSDFYGGKIRKITPDGVVTTIADSFYEPRGIAVDTDGNIYVCNGNHTIKKVTSNGTVTNLAGSGVYGFADGQGASASFYGPIGIAIGLNGNIFVGDHGNHKIRMITADGYVTTYAGSGNYDGVDGALTEAGFMEPMGLTFAVDGTLYVGDRSVHKVRKVTNAMVSTLAGDGNVPYGHINGVGTQAKFYHPAGVAVFGDNLYVAEYQGYIRKINLSGYTISPSLPAGLSFDSTTGTISGTPTEASVATNYTIIGYNANGSSNSNVSIEVMGGQPFALFTATPNPAACNQEVTFDASSSYHSNPTGNSIVSYDWDLDNDGAFDDATGINTVHTFSSFGTYTVGLRITDNCIPAKTDIHFMDVSVSQGNHPPIPNTGGPYTINQGSMLTLDASNSSDPDAICGDSIVNYQWDLNNDGVFETSGSMIGLTWAQLVSSGINTAGIYTIRLRVIDTFGVPAISDTTLTIISPPTASAQSFCGSAMVSNLVATGVNLQWYAIDTGGIALEPTTILTTNTYYVSQTVNAIETDRTAVVVTVNPLPTLSILQTNVLCAGASTGLITASVSGGAAPYTYAWTSANTSPSITTILTSIGNNPAAIGLPAETYTVTVTDGNGCMTSKTTVITQPIPIVLTTSQVDPVCNGGTGTINFSATGGTAKVAYIANSASNSVTVLDRNTNLPIATIPVGSTPHGVSVTPDGNFVYVTNNGSNSVSVINTSTNTVIATIPVGTNPFGIRVTPDGSKVYVSNQGSNNVKVINTSSNTVIATIQVGNQPAGVAISPNGTKVYIGNRGAFTVSIIDNLTNSVINTVSGFSGPYGIAVSPDNSKYYVVCYNSDNLKVVDANTNIILAVIPMDYSFFDAGDPFDVVLNPSGTRAYVGRLYNNSISVVNTLNNTVISTIPVGNDPYGLSYDASNDKLYTANANANTISVINALTNTVTSTLTGFNGPTSWGNFLGNVSGSANTMRYTVNGVPQTSNTFTGPAGVYSVVATDANGCSASTTVELVQPAPIVFTNLYIYRNVSCNGANDGAIAVNASGGNPNSCGQNPYSINPAPPGSYMSNGVFWGLTGTVEGKVYTITYTDCKGCTKDTTITLFEPGPLAKPTITADGPTDFCLGGSVILTSSPGSSYLWSTGATTQSITVSSPGSYTVQVTDANGCQSPPSIATTVTVNIAAHCFTEIPDSNFEQALIDLGYDTVIDGNVLTSNISGVADLTVSNRNIQDLTGIKAFTSLKNLDCSANQIVNLDVSGLSSLEYLYTRASQLTNINLSGLTSLKYLYCNYNNLSSLTVVNLPSLLTINCEYNILTSLTLGGLTSLDRISCDHNQLSTLDLNGGLPVLTVLNCTNNLLNSLDANNLPGLQELYCQYNQLTSLSMKNATSVKILYCFLNQLTSLDVSGLAQMHTLECSFNNISNLNFTGCVGLQGLYCSANQLTSIDVSGLPILGDLFCYNNQLNNLNVHGVTSLTLLLCHHNQLSSLDLTGLTLVRGMDCTSNPNLSCIQVTDVATASSTSNWVKEATATYSRSCPPIALPQTFCYGAKVSNLIAQGTAIKWYLDATGGTKLATTIVLTSRNYYVTQTTNGLESDRTAVAVTVNPKSIAGTISASGTICEGSTKTLTLSTSHIGTVQWQSSTESTSTGFSDTVGATANSYSTNPLSTTTYFKAVVTSGVCASAITPVITITVSPTAVAGTISGGGVTVCKAAPTAIPVVTNSTTLTVVGYSGSVFVWKKATTLNGTYSTILGATTPVYVASNLTATTYYKVEVKSGVCSVTAEPVVITVSPTSVAGSISGTGTICYNTGKILTLSSTHKGTVQWQLASVLEGPYSDIIGETGTTLNTGNLTSSTYYRAMVTNGVCSSKVTLPVKITVTPQSVAGTISGGGVTVCPGINSTLLALSGYTGKIQWQSSTDSSFASYITLTGTKATYTAKNLSTTTYYRALVINGIASCFPAISEPVAINIANPINTGTIAGNDVVCYGTIASMVVSGYDEGATVQWQKATTLTGSYTSIEGAVLPIYTTPSLTASVFYRVLVTKNGCSSVTSGFKVTVQKAVAGTIIGGTIAPLTVCVGTPSELSLIGYSGTTFQWLSSVSTVTTSFTPISGATSATYMTNNPIVGTTYYRAIVSYPGCTSLLTPIINVAVATCSNAKMESSASVFSASAYPNPFNDNFMIDMATSSQEKIQILVYDSVGKLIEKREIKPSEVATQEIGGNYPSGIYNIMVNQGTEVKVLRVIKR